MKLISSSDVRCIMRYGGGIIVSFAMARIHFAVLSPILMLVAWDFLFVRCLLSVSLICLYQITWG